jgi:PEP-CTERM motif-containing protein
MKRFLAAVTLLCPLLTQCAYADSIPTFVVQANIPFQVDIGENQFPPATFNGSGAYITTTNGDVVCYGWCTPGSVLPTGSTLKPNIDIIAFGGGNGSISLGSVTFGGQVHPVADLHELAPAITALGSFQFPTDGRSSFTVTVPAMIDGLIGGDTLDLAGEFNLQVPPGKLVLTFDFFPGGGGVPPNYEFSHGLFTTTPEPGTLGLMASGLAGIVGAVRRKRNNNFSAPVDGLPGPERL